MPFLAHSLKIFIKEVENQYILSNKVFFAVCEMQKSENFEKFAEKRIKLRDLPNKVPLKKQGCVMKSPFSFKISLKKVNF